MYLYVPKGWRECSGLESQTAIFFSNFLLNILGVLSWQSEYPGKLKSCLIPQLHDGKYGNVGALADSAADTAEEEICCDIHRAIRDCTGRSQLKPPGLDT